MTLFFAMLRTLPPAPPVRPQGRLLDDLRRLVEVEFTSRFDSVLIAADPVAEATAPHIDSLRAEVIFYVVREQARKCSTPRPAAGQPLADGDRARW